MLLIHPPVAKPSEPPAGIARLAGFLRSHGVSVTLADLNLEGQFALLSSSAGLPGAVAQGDAADAFTRRSLRNRERNIAALRDRGTYGNIDRYRKSVFELERALGRTAVSAAAASAAGSALSPGEQRPAAGGRQIRLTPADYGDSAFSPTSSGGLIAAAEHPEANPFYFFFSRRLPELLETDAKHGASHAAARDRREPEQIVGFSLNYLSQAVCAFAMIGFLRRAYGGRCRIVLGGGLVTSWMRRPGFRNPFAGLVDEVVAGPGEERLLALSGEDRTGGEPFAEGAAQTAENGLRLPAALPDYDDLELAGYLAPGGVLPYAASSGCMWGRCAFCPEHAEGNQYRPVPPGRAVSELHSLSARYSPALVHILDNELSPALLKKLTASPPGGAWYGFARCSELLEDPGFCVDLRKSGCVMLKLGLESGNQAVLDAMGKGITLAAVSRILKNLRAAGIATFVYLLFGTPWECPEAARETLEFTARHAETIGWLNTAVFNLPADSELAETLPVRPFYDGDLSLYREFSHPAGWNRGSVRRFLDREFRRHPAVAPILRRTPPVFTSNHAPFFL